MLNQGFGVLLFEASQGAIGLVARDFELVGHVLVFVLVGPFYSILCKVGVYCVSVGNSMLRHFRNKGVVIEYIVMSPLPEHVLHIILFLKLIHACGFLIEIKMLMSRKNTVFQFGF